MTTQTCPSCGGFGVLTLGCAALSKLPTLAIKREHVGRTCIVCNGDGVVQILNIVFPSGSGCEVQIPVSNLKSEISNPPSNN